MAQRIKALCKAWYDKVIEVPCGTVVYNAETGEYICDITEHGQEITLLKGVHVGDWETGTSVQQPARRHVLHNSREPMQELMVILELKLLVDVGGW